MTGVQTCALPIWTRNYDATTGILTVTMNMTGATFTATECQPASFCTNTSGSCSCALKITDPTYTPSIYKQCQTACSEWAVKDIACPDAGCYGFGVTLPDAFSNANHVPPPSPIVLSQHFGMERRVCDRRQEQRRVRIYDVAE